MKSYGQFCPIAKAAELFCERWTALVIRNIANGAHRYGDIRRGVPHMSSTLLSKRLKELESEGIIRREKAVDGQYWRYLLTEAGLEFVPLVAALGAWGQRWSRRDLAEGELDLGLLIWGLEHCVDPAAFEEGRVTLRLEITDQPRHKAFYWFVNEAGAMDFCVSDPGFDIDLYLAATLKDMTHVYRGDVTVAHALESGMLEAIGARPLVRRLGDWLNLGPLAEIPPAEEGPARALAATGQ